MATWVRGIKIRIHTRDRGGFRDSQSHRPQNRPVCAVGPVKVGNIRAGRQGNAQFVSSGGVLVILGDPFADFRCGDANDGVGGSIVVRVSAKDLNAEGAPLDVGRVPYERLFDHKAQETWEPLTVAEIGAGQKPAQLLTDRLLLRMAQSY